MNTAVIMHGWEESPDGNWLPWLGQQLEGRGWKVEIPLLPGGKFPQLDEWMKVLASLSPDEHTVLIGHSLACALILKYLEQSNVQLKGAVMVAAWDWLMDDVKEEHRPFFEQGFEYSAIKNLDIPKFIINSTTDPWIDIAKAQPLADKIGAQFIAINDAGHFMERDGYKEFPQLLELLEREFPQ